MTNGRSGAYPEHLEGPAGATGPTGPTVPAAPVRPGGGHDARDDVAVSLPGDVGISPTVRRDPWSALDAATREALLALRGPDGPEGPDGATRPDPDPHDTDPATRHVWIPDETGPVAALRLRPADDDARLVEHLCVRADVRRIGLAGALLSDVVARDGGRPLLADVPAEAAALFARLGFEPVATVLDTGAVAALTRMRRASDVPWRED